MLNLAKPLAGKPAETAIRMATHKANAEIAKQDALIDGRAEQPHVDPTPVRDSPRSKLSQLIDHDFPFDESQLAAIHGMAQERFACLTGAAGTGKTTCTKKLVDELQHALAMVDMATYFAKGKDAGADPDDDYEITEQFVPSICLCSFTGRASQMIKKNFPRDWHSNIMTIHRMLAYMPEWYEDFDEESGEMVNKMRFVPTYNASFKLPWDVIVIDEAGMLSVDLWERILDAAKDGCRIYMIGDINQLPPTHGRSIFGFAMTKWPSWELTHIHRQKGVNNAIVDNAWSVLKGQTPKGEDTKADPNWKFAMMELPGDSNTASRYVRAFLAKIKGPLYDPIRDTVITPINAFEQTSGYALGQDPLNRELSVMFNANTVENPRYKIDAGRDRKYFAVGDKVMATRNDHEAGITNGMTGIITSIARNGAYQGDTNLFDTIDNVNQYLKDGPEDDSDTFSLDDLMGSMEGEEEGEKTPKDSRDRGPASHIVTVRFGEGDHAFELPFQTLAEVASLMMAYVVTCHKMQGGESPLVIVIVHQAHKRMLFREWLYTAITRASQRCIVLYTRQGLATALNKQNIKGTTLAQKVETFVKLQEKGLVGSAVKVRIPERESLSKEIRPFAQTMVDQKRGQAAVDMMNELAELEGLETKPEPEPIKVKTEKINIFVTLVNESKTIINEAVKNAQPEVVDGGDLTREQKREAEMQRIEDRMNRIREEQHAKLKQDLILSIADHSWKHPPIKSMADEIRESAILAPPLQAGPPQPTMAPIRSTFKLNLAALKK